MKFNDYQELAADTAIYPEMGTASPLALAYVSLGVAGEGGEVAEKTKKLIRNLSPVDSDFRLKMTKELGDVLWYVAMMCCELGISMDTVAAENLEKLADRKRRGVLNRGEGDSR